MSDLKEIRIFLASSEELSDDRAKFGNLIRRLDALYEPRGIRIRLCMWEDLEAHYLGRRTQDFYDEHVRSSDMFLALFHRRGGEFTIEETRQAFDAYKQNNLKPKSFVYMRALAEGEIEEPELQEFKRDLYDNLGHFWSNYANTDMMQLHFVMQLQRVENQIQLSVEDSKVTVDGLTVADLARVPFAANNTLLQSLNSSIALLESHGIDSPDLQRMREQKTQLENDLLSTAQTIASLQLTATSERLRRAVELFEKGDNRGADALLDAEAIADEARRNIALFQAGQQARQAAIGNIEELKLKAKNLLTLYDQKDRIDQAEAAYAEALSIAHGIQLGGEELQQLLYDYYKFLVDYTRYEHIHEVEEEYLRHTVELYGEEHYSTAAAYNNIGLVCDDRGDYDQAIACFERALAIDRKLLGEEAPEIATSYLNIGNAYYGLRQYDRALEYYRKALTIDEKVFGEAHPETAKTYDNMGNAYDEQGDLEQALKYKLKALEIFEKVLGTEHLDTATSYNNVGVVYRKQGEWDKALEYYLKDLAITEKVLGPAHPLTASTYTNIAIVYDTQQDYPAALRYYEKALAIFESVLGPTHPETCRTYYNIGALHLDQGHTDEALSWMQKAAAGGHPKAQQWLEVHGKKK